MTSKDENPLIAASRLSAATIAKGYRTSGLHAYSDANGTPLFWRIREKHPNDEKWIRPIHHNGRAFVLGEPKAPPNGKPLYRLPNLPGDSVVFVVKGETCADALAGLGITTTD